ncbi:hypothetical protein D3C80_944410 [compost metagenome]
MTAEAAPNSTRLKGASVPGGPEAWRMPEKARQRSYFSQSIRAMKMKGRTFNTIQKGWVMIWKRLMRRTP